MSRKVQNDIGEIILEAEARAGELLKEVPKQSGSRGVGKKVEFKNRTPLLSDLGVTKLQSHNWQRVAAVPAEARRRWVAEAKDSGHGDRRVEFRKGTPLSAFGVTKRNCCVRFRNSADAMCL